MSSGIFTSISFTSNEQDLLSMRLRSPRFLVIQPHFPATKQKLHGFPSSKVSVWGRKAKSLSSLRPKRRQGFICFEGSLQVFNSMDVCNVSLTVVMLLSYIFSFSLLQQAINFLIQHKQALIIVRKHERDHSMRWRRRKLTQKERRLNREFKARCRQTSFLCSIFSWLTLLVFSL